MADSGKILIVDDDTSNIEILISILADTYEILFATNGDNALASIEREVPDLVLLDVMMPGMDGYQVCQTLKENPDTSNIPVIFITALGNAKDEAKGLEMGAIDYITKPFNPPVVQIRVRNHLELKHARDQLEKVSLTDHLTGLANRRRFDELLDREWRRLARLKAPLSLIMIDIDHFKAFNDTYGHQEGDECLKDVGGAIGRAVNRPQDLTARYGGEEFICVLPETEYKGALLIAKRIKNAISDLGIANQNSSVSNTVTASFGLASVRCDHSVTPEQIIEMADEQLYKAKEAGRNRVIWIDVINEQ